jgi:phosphoenolpyruvate synthase/pyruvate phosphate dikinase
MSLRSLLKTMGLLRKFLKSKNVKTIKELFFKGKLSMTLMKKLRTLLEQTDKPLAVRSSGLFEDSLMQPFAGVFETYILPNSHDDLKVRLQQLSEAVKLVYASVYSKISRDYIQAIHYKLEEEKWQL